MPGSTSSDSASVIMFPLSLPRVPCAGCWVLSRVPSAVGSTLLRLQRFFFARLPDRELLPVAARADERAVGAVEIGHVLPAAHVRLDQDALVRLAVELEVLHAAHVDHLDLP